MKSPYFPLLDFREHTEYNTARLWGRILSCAPVFNRRWSGCLRSDFYHHFRHVIKTDSGCFLDRVESGEEIVITRHGKPVARLVPTPPESTSYKRAPHWNIFEPGREFERIHSTGRPPKADRDAGRP